MKYTLVRLIETKDPVLISNHIETLVDLGNKIDEIVSPYLCEYLDVNIPTPLYIFFNKGFDSGISLGEEMEIKLETCFKSKKKWTKYPEDYDFYAVDKTESDRLKEHHNLIF